MVSNKNLLFFLLCTVFLTIGVVVLTGIGIGVWFGTRELTATPTVATPHEFLIGVNSELQAGQAFTNGFIELELSLPNGVMTQGNVLVYLDGVKRNSYKTFPSNLRIPTQNLQDGTHNITVMAVSTRNARGVGEIIILVQDPGFILVSIEYPSSILPGMEMTIMAVLSREASHFVSNLSSIFGQPMVLNSTTQNGAILTGSILIPSDLLAVEQFYSIPLVVYSIDQKTLMVPGIEVFFQLGATNPFSIDEGIIDMRSFPLTEATNSTNSTLNVALPQSFVSITTGQSVQVALEIIEGSTASEVLVGFQGFGQHFIIPIPSLRNETLVRRRSTRKTNSGTQIISFSLALPTGAIESGEDIEMLIRLKNMIGELGPIQRIDILTSKSEKGTFHVTLTWDQEADLDIHVIDPNNEEIYFFARSSSSQEGFLDLDSNTGCKIDRIKTENVFYNMAISGQYIIRVDLWSACAVTESINYEVLVEGCDVMQTVTGSFLPSEASRGTAGSGREVLVLNVICNAFLANGTVSYMTPMSRFNPLGSIVRVVDDAGNVLGTSQVERDVTDAKRGVYSVSYGATETDSAVYVEFLSTNNKIKVTDHTETNIHMYRVTDGIIPSKGVTARRDTVISTEDGSGSFHIMVTLTRGLPLYLSYGGQVTDYPLIANWENGEYAKDANFPVSYFNGETIAIGGHSTDPDEFDDSVLLHELGHLIIARTKTVIKGGGAHSGAPIAPYFAFSEGYATYIGQKIIGHLKYCDGWCYNIANLPDSYLGTTAANDASSGYISEFLVASVAFKLDDQLGLGAMMCQSLTDPNKLLLEANYNRLGSLTAVDFSDMISIVVCPLEVAQRNPASDLLNDHNLPWIQEVDFCA